MPNAAGIKIDSDKELLMLKFQHDNDFRSFVTNAATYSFSGRENNRLFTRSNDRFFYSHFVTGLGFNLDGRSVVAADLDRDGDPDLVVRNLQEKPIQVLENRLQTHHRFLDVELRSQGKNTRGIGAKVSATCGGKRQVRQVTAGNAFLAQSPYNLLFGFGTCEDNIMLKIQWPDGTMQQLHGIKANQRIRIQHR